MNALGECFPLMLKCKTLNVESISNNTALLFIILMSETTTAWRNVLLSEW